MTENETMKKPILEVQNLTKVYGDRTAVRGISFTVDGCGVYGLLGPNGAGKSTTMNMITGCLAVTSGCITVGGFDVVKNPAEAKRRIGYLPEIPPLYPEMTPYEYLSFVAEAKGVKAARAERQVEEAMKLTELTEVSDRLIRNLSKGYRQRVGIAQAMLGNPDVIILDEPTVGLDPKQIIGIRDLIRRLGEIRTVILSSHLLAEIQAVSDHVMILSHGRLVANDTVSALEAQVNRNAAIDLTVKGSVTDTVRILKTVPGICRFTPIRGKDAGTVEVRLETADSADPREELFFAFANEGIPLLRLERSVLTLEDIFLRLTEESLEESEESEETDGGTAAGTSSGSVEADEKKTSETEESEGSES